MSNSLRSLLKLLLPVVIILLIGCGGGGGDEGGGVVVDTTPPPVPTGMTATTVSASRIDLAWSASTDAVGYKIYRNSTFYLNRFGATTTLQDINLTANTTFNYRVSAYDSAGNESAQSALASATTLDTATVLLGTAANDYGRGVAVDSSGNVYVTGWTAGALNGISNPGGADIFLSKYNSSGVRQWTRLLGTTGVVDPIASTDLGSYGLNVAVDSPRNFVYVTGYTTANMGGQTHSNPGIRNAFLFRCRLDNTSPETAVLYGWTQESAGNAVAVDANGNVYVAGYTGAVKDILLLKYNPSLVLENLNQIGSAGDDVAIGVAVNATGDAIFVTGMAGGILPLGTGTSPAYAGNGDLFIARFNAVPAIQWSTLLGSSAMDAGLAINVQGSTIKVAGMTAGTLPGKTSFGGSDIVVASYTALGAANWVEQLGTAADEVAYGIVVDSIGNSYITGFTGGSPSPFKPNAGLEDLFLIKFGIGGGTPFAISLAGTTAGDEGRAIAIRESDNILYVVGFTEGSLDGEPNSGGYDMGLLKFNLAGEQQ